MSFALLWLFLAACCSSAANGFIKQASQAGTGPAIGFISVPFVIGAGLFGIGLIFYWKALQSLPLTVGYPVLVGTIMVLTSLVGLWAFQERLGLIHVFGMVLILIGIAMLSVRTG